MANCKPNAWRVPRTRRDVIEDAIMVGCLIALLAAIVGASWLVLTDGAP